MAKTADAPDYEAAAEKQGESSMEVTNYQTHANRPNQETPFGSQTWTETSGIDPTTGKPVPRWTQTTTLTPEMQRALDAQQNVTTGRSEIGANMMNRVANEYGPTMDWSKFTDAGGGVGGADAYRGRAGDALMSAFSDRMEPKFERATASLETQLRNRGFKPGDEGYNQALADIRQSQGDQFNQAMYQAQQLESQEGQRMQGMDMTSSSYDTQRRQQEITEEMSRRGFSLNEINALLTGQQVGLPSMPGFNQAQRSETVQYNQAAQNQYQASLDAANAQNAMVGDMMSAVTSPFSIASDRRLKTDIRRIGTGVLGLPLYVFRYLWDAVGTVRAGHMADEVALVMPEAVHVIPGTSALAVDYAALYQQGPTS